MTIEVDEYFAGVRANDRTLLARAITLIESEAEMHRRTAEELLERLLPYTGKSVRIGISGVPGAGKSTFIEALGLRLVEGGHRVAVLTVDPTSTQSGGSILGDKTRMGELSRRSEALIRPSPSGGALGGVARKTREAMLVCEAAGYDIVLVETVGVGQSETDVAAMVDVFALLLLPNAGDELQGIKRGILELADVLVVNKADAAQRAHAEQTKAWYDNALRHLFALSPEDKPEVLLASALEGTGVAEVHDAILELHSGRVGSGEINERRSAQAMQWMQHVLERELLRRLHAHPPTRRRYNELLAEVEAGKAIPTRAAREVLEAFLTSV